MAVATEQIVSDIVDSSTLAILTKSEIDQQITTAKQYPRSIKKFRQLCLEMATLTEKVAGECMYAVPRAGKMIEGPSARLSEIVASAWGNCRAGARIISEEREFIVAQGIFHDLENNVSITYEVKRRITDKHGNRFKTDMIGVTGNAACSIALRNAVFKGIPKAFWDDIYEAARTTAMGDSKTINTRRAEGINHLAKFGVTEDQICSTLKVGGVEDIGLDELLILKGIATAIRDGDTTAEQAFGIIDSAPYQSKKTESLNEDILNGSRKKNNESKSKHKKKPDAGKSKHKQPAPDPSSLDDAFGPQETNKIDLIARIKAAKQSEILGLQSLILDLKTEDQEDCRDEITKRKDELRVGDDAENKQVPY